MKNDCIRRPAILFATTLLVMALAAPSPGAEIQACFAPPLSGTCDPLRTILGAINGAHSTIRLQMYSLTLREVADALVRAKRRGVDVRLIVDRGQLHQDRNDSARVETLAAAGIPVLLDPVPGLMHDKVMVIDRETVLTGSFNYTWGAEHLNAENLIVLHDSDWAATYLRDWDQRAAQSHPISAGNGPSGAVLGNRRTMIYQWPGCPYYGQVSPRNRIVFPDARTAEEAGYRPARCR
ncbi:MAG TPA: phospholipase D family protein [Candidatus Binataceae bacterium]|nr:phospholipase D family protein [Candidatus Binataceae bacterium]